MTDTLDFAHADAEAVAKQQDELITLYEQVWLTGWKNDDPFFSRERFVDRLGKHLNAPGFELVAARIGNQLIGYIYGFSRARDDKFIVCELLVAEEYQRHGIASRLHDELLNHRSEQTAELLVEKENAPAQAAYRGWGWQKTGDLKPTADAPNYDVMMIELPLRA